MALQTAEEIKAQGQLAGILYGAAQGPARRTVSAGTKIGVFFRL